MPWQWRSAAKAPMSSGGGGSERELQELIKKQSRDFAAHKKELDQLKRELAKANQSGGKPAAAGSSQQAADGGAKKKFWSCVGCSYKENFLSRQTCRECGLQKGSPAALPPGLGATPGVQTAVAAAAAEKAAAAKAAAAAAARAAEEAAKAAKHAKTVEPGGTEAVPGAMAVDGLLADRIASTEAYIRLLKGGKDSLGWERAKVQLEAAEEDLKALREEQRAARPVAARMQASAAKLARCREAATLVNLELIEAQAWVKVVSERQGEAEAQLLVAEAEDQALRAEAGADMVEIQVKGVLETVAQELFKTGLPPELCQGVALAISQVYNQLAASGTLAGAGGGAAPAAVPASRGDSAAGRAEPAAAAAAAAACSTATGGVLGRRRQQWLRDGPCGVLLRLRQRLLGAETLRCLRPRRPRRALLQRALRQPLVQQRALLPRRRRPRSIRRRKQPTTRLWLPVRLRVPACRAKARRTSSGRGSQRRPGSRISASTCAGMRYPPAAVRRLAAVRRCCSQAWCSRGRYCRVPPGCPRRSCRHGRRACGSTASSTGALQE